MRALRATAFVIASIWLLVQPAWAESRVALVVGNSSYEKVPELTNPVRDAGDMGRALERLNFKVTQLKNATAHEMRKAVVEFGRAAEGAEIAIIFYAGHGMEVAGENWLIPITAELRSDTDIESEAVSLRSISLQVSRARQLGLVILDACRNNPFAAKMKRSINNRTVTRGLAPTEPSDNVLIAYAARDGTTASDGDGRNSPFTTALLQHIETPGLEVSFLFRRVRDDVMKATKREQQPFVYGSLSKEEVYLKPPATASAQTPRIQTEEPASTEDERFWQAIKPRGYASLFEQFLEQYPYSPHASEARQRLGELKSKEVVAIAPSGPDAQSAAAAPKQDEKNVIKGNEKVNPEPSARNLFTASDGQRISAVAAAQRLDLPKFEISANQGTPLVTNSKFVGVWSSKRGWNGKGRYGMVIITEASATGLARGYYLWGPPVKNSWTQDAAGYKWFSEYIVNDKFSIKVNPEVTAILDGKNVLTLATTKPDKPLIKSSIELRPIWQLARIPEDVQPSVKREQAAPRKRSAKEAASGPNLPRGAGGSTMEDRYRACRKLVNGFARREACARTGAI